MRALAPAVILLLLVCDALLWSASRSFVPHDLTVSFLDIGQGDSILVRAPSGATVLVDGGPGNAVLRQLAATLPWWDRSIDLMIATHPDADHVTGLISVLQRYQVKRIVQSSVEGSTSVWHELERTMQEEGAPITIATRGQTFDLGDGAYLEILFPDRQVAHVETNTGSVVARLVYGDTSFMLTGDMPQSVENYLMELDSSRDQSTVLKAGHHGSKNSSSPYFLGFVNPAYGVFSRGCNNRYGHPAPETVARFALFGIPTEDTCTQGRVTFVSDGKTVSIAK